MDDKKLRIVIAMLPEVIEIEPWVKIVWLPTNRMFADGLTKIDSPLVFPAEGFMHAAVVTFPPAVRKRRPTHALHVRRARRGLSGPHRLVGGCSRPA